MRLLRTLTERLEDVEINGYSPLQKADEQNKSTAKNSKTESQPQATNSKKSKKKKKKQQQHQSAAPAPAPNLSDEADKKKESKPNPSSSPEDDLSDPVAVALLGMGFTAEQITSAAKALGGFDKATADDMVMWILTGGEVNNDEQEQDNTIEANTDSGFDDSNHSEPVSTSKAEKKAAAKAKREAEELARKRQEEIAAAERAAAKREEQRRIRREWNEREQARQEVEKNAKVAEAVAKKKHAELQKMQATKAPTLPVIPPTINVGGVKGKSKNGPPQTVVAGGKKGVSVSNMGIPKGPNVKAPKILARPNNAPPTAAQVGASNQPLFPPGQDPANAKANQPLKSRNPSQSRLQQALPPIPASYAPQAMPNLPSNNYYNHSPAGSSSFVYDGVYGKDAGSMPLMGGSTSNYYSSQPSGNVPPPGFKSSVLPPAGPNDPSLNAAVNPLGEIRATAREFVPTSFAPVSESTPTSVEFNAVPSMSSQPATVSHSSPPADNQSNPTEVSSLLDPMSSLLNTAIPAPVTKGDSPVQSATSSITGFSGTVEEATTSRVGSALTFESAVGGIQTSSILESISYGAQDSGLGGLSSGGIWGDSNNNQSSNLGGLVGLNFSSFLNGGVDQKNEGQSSNIQGGQSSNNQGSTWGTGTGGSIW